jgi:hypothetical protein
LADGKQLFWKNMYRRPKFLEKLLEIRREMALEADYDVDLFTELARSGVRREVPDGPAEAEDEAATPELRASRGLAANIER